MAKKGGGSKNGGFNPNRDARGRFASATFKGRYVGSRTKSERKSQQLDARDSVRAVRDKKELARRKENIERTKAMSPAAWKALSLGLKLSDMGIQVSPRLPIQRNDLTRSAKAGRVARAKAKATTKRVSQNKRKSAK